MSKLRLLTLNLHCLEEDNIQQNQDRIISSILEKNIDVILLQEVAQYSDKPILLEEIKETNYGYDLKLALKDKGYNFFYYFEPIKHSFGKYDEGLSILSKYEMSDIKSFYISNTKDYSNWKSRKAVQANLTINDISMSFVSVHLGWTDEYEKFEDQIDQLLVNLNKNNTWILAGDYNVSPTTKEYQYLLSKGLVDLYGQDENYLMDPTHISNMDLHVGETRIDYFFSNKKISVIDRDILFKEKRVSDHYGVYIELDFNQSQ